MSKKAKRKPLNKIEPMPVCDLDYRARSDMETLRRADEIRGDKGRLSAAKKEATKDLKALQRVAGK